MRGLHLSDFKTYCIVTKIKTAWYQWKERHTVNRTGEKPEIDIKMQITFDKDEKAVQWRKDSLFNKQCLKKLHINRQGEPTT